MKDIQVGKIYRNPHPNFPDNDFLIVTAETKHEFRYYYLHEPDSELNWPKCHAQYYWVKAYEDAE